MAAEDISAYHAAYVALAIHIDARLYTADGELMRRLPGRAVHIREYGSDSGSI